MTKETAKHIVPTNEYYESPYIPSTVEASDYSTIPLLPVEAHSILVGNTGKRIPTVDKLALQRISELDESDIQVDYKKVRKQVARELGLDDDWE